MIKNNKWKALLSSLLVLSPCLFGLILWNQLPDSMTIHFGANGTPDGTGSKVFAVFGLPVIMLVLHWLCLIITSLDPKQKGQNKKALGMLFWIMPMISIVVQGSFYCVSLGKTNHIMLLFPFLFGIIFILMGNYLPKVKQNSTLGIKLYWTLNNEENWNKTHRLGGKLWFFGGFVVMLTAFLPLSWMISVMIATFAVIMLVPTIYSFCLYRKHKKAGISYGTKQSVKKRILNIVIVLVLSAALLVGLGFLMFTGDITYTFYDTSLRIDATFGENLTIYYSEIDEVYQTEPGFDKGIRTYGFNSARLSIGTFQNEKFGQYTLYAYNSSDTAVVIRSGEKVLVITGKDLVETMNLYDKLAAAIQQQ